MTHRILSLLLLILLPGVSDVFSQGNSNYERRRAEIVERQQSARTQIENLEEQIRTYTERLGYATDRFDQMFRQFEELERLIALQQEQIRQMNQEQREIREEIELVEENIAELEVRLHDLIEQYKATLTYLYKNGRTTELALIFTSTSINQLLVRSYYLTRFDEHRQKQVGEIQQTQAEMEQSKIDLEETRQRNQIALATIREETESLEQKKDLQSRNIALLREDRNNLQEQLENFQSQRDQLNNTLTELMEEEERILSERENAGNAGGGNFRVSDNELSAYENSFESQRGQLPWPVSNGTITERFGVRSHPVFHTRTNNPGIDIATASRNPVQVVSDGYVFGIQPLQGFGEVIFVNHGTYKTAYGNLSDTYVRKNQVLRQGDVIGLSGDENSIRGEVLFFLIREGSRNVDPESWLQMPVQ
ncbi:MAG: peptidoglycan DD-metalloendopeptidase family protein [Balneolaceae bacterium]